MRRCTSWPKTRLGGKPSEQSPYTEIWTTTTHKDCWSPQKLPRLMINSNLVQRIKLGSTRPGLILDRITNVAVPFHIRLEIIWASQRCEQKINFEKYSFGILPKVDLFQPHAFIKIHLKETLNSKKNIWRVSTYMVFLIFCNFAQTCILSYRVEILAYDRLLAFFDFAEKIQLILPMRICFPSKTFFKKLDSKISSQFL